MSDYVDLVPRNAVPLFLDRLPNSLRAGGINKGREGHESRGDTQASGDTPSGQVGSDRSHESVRLRSGSPKRVSAMGVGFSQQSVGSVPLVTETPVAAMTMRPFSMTEAWQAWLACQPQCSYERRRWNDPASWVYWHVESWEECLRNMPEQSYHRRWTGDAWARWECESLCPMQYTSVSDGLIEVSPAAVLYTQGQISNTFGSGSHKGVPVDETIRQIQAEPDSTKHIMQHMPEINLFELDGRLYSINKRRLFVYKVLNCMDVLDKVVARLLPRDDPIL